MSKKVKHMNDKYFISDATNFPIVIVGCVDKKLRFIRTPWDLPNDIEYHVLALHIKEKDYKTIEVFFKYGKAVERGAWV